MVVYVVAMSPALSLFCLAFTLAGVRELWFERWVSISLEKRKKYYRLGL